MRNRSTNADTLMRIRLPLPHKALHPNTRTHWAAKARQVKIAREAARRETFKLLRDVEVPTIPRSYSVTRYYKGKSPDADNTLSSMKAYLDGICDALRTDDKTLEMTGIKRIKASENYVEIDLEFEDLS